MSCNIWFALAGLRIGGASLVDGAAKLGFGERIPFDLPTAASQVTSGKGGQPGGFLEVDETVAEAAGSWFSQHLCGAGSGVCPGCVPAVFARGKGRVTTGASSRGAAPGSQRNAAQAAALVSRSLLPEQPTLGPPIL